MLKAKASVANAAEITARRKASGKAQGRNLEDMSAERTSLRVE